MQTVRMALNAMATRFELLLHGDDAVLLRGAGEEALAEIKRLEQQLSFYDPTSEISQLNANASKEPVRVTPRLYSLLRKAAEIHNETHGAFDVTVGPLMRCWGFVRGRGTWPEEHERKEALTKTGMDKVVLNDAERTVAFRQPGMALDLGAIGKGYAIEEAGMFLREGGITSALLHGGTSTMLAIGTPPQNTDGWPIGISDPLDDSQMLTSTSIRDEALSVSAPRGKGFQKDGKMWGHVIDPRKGYPVQGATLSAVAHPSAMICDAISTALLAMRREDGKQVQQKFHGMRTLCVYDDTGAADLVSLEFHSTHPTNQ
ncbi:MAG: FAD:protein FMN transferase [Rhodothermaceae bacterium]|nr:FAD:protein FMN transferase [Rhodothermaceae bacterium]MXX57911.1 FAD:protein FMN transferase [Rhodothermaceae bacterium]MYD18910.1 FAD:protein FMN transferase [Rhodothermaceae bacterium]MYD56916.1 FAD:protein FMN transferase [Rhodothermaceae bacterium]MYI44394.1 FAD:protein FMN transferase [Rhodothermaceae bacterium]